jgi:sec-independent protein translocase protein TatA
MPFIPNIGPGELILILIIALVVLGPGKLPDVAQSLGKSLREFRKAASDVQDAAKVDAPAPPVQPTPSPNVPAVPAAPAAVAASAPAAVAAPVAATAETPAALAAEPVPTGASGASGTPDSNAS